MKKRTRAAVVIYGIIILGAAWFIGQKPEGVSYAEYFSLQPKYEGHTITYWMEQPWGYNQGKATDWDAAVESTGVKSVPYLVKWIDRPPNHHAGVSYPERALRGFEVLGPAAGPAIPELIKRIGQNQDFADRALLAIGKESVLPLADKLVETLSDTNNPFFDGGIRMEVRKTSGYHIRGCILRVLSRMGTNAESALPAVIACLNTESSLHHAEAAGVLASIGRNQPGTVVPVLMGAFSNSSGTNPSPAIGFGRGGYRRARGAIATALGEAGGSRPHVVIPFLTDFLARNDAQAADRGAVAQALARIGKDAPDSVLPVLLAALTNGNSTASDRDSIASCVAGIGRGQPAVVVPALIFALTNSSAQAEPGIVAALGTLGTNAGAAIPFLLQAGASTNWIVRSRAAFAVKAIAPETPGALAPLIKNLEGSDRYARYRALHELGELGTNGVEALPALVKLLSHPNYQIRTDTARCIQSINQFSDEIISALGENLSATNSFTAQEARATLGKFAAKSQLAFTTLIVKGLNGPVDREVRQQTKYTLINLSREDPTFLMQSLEASDATIRYGALRVFYELAARVTGSASKLRDLANHDPDQNVRGIAADVLKMQE